MTPHTQPAPETHGIQVDLWQWSLTDRTELREVLSRAERARADRFVRAEDRARFVTARGVLRHVLAEYVGQAADQLDLRRAEFGKPYCPGGPGFNLSHAGGVALLAVTPEHDGTSVPLGVDIERYRPMLSDLARRYFTPGEVAELEDLAPERREAGFFRCWTRKEAMIKALGTGLHTPLDAIEVTLTPGARPRVLSTAPDLPQPPDWTLHHLELAPDLPGAIAAISAPQGLRVSSPRDPTG